MNRILSLTACTMTLLAGLAAPGQALAAYPVQTPDTAQPHRSGLQFAQRAVEMFIGSRGERVYVDVRTGEIIAVEPARRDRYRNYQDDYLDDYGRDEVWNEPDYEPERRDGGFREVPAERRARAYPQDPGRNSVVRVPDTRVDRAPIPEAAPRNRSATRPNANEVRQASNPPLDNRATGTVNRTSVPDPLVIKADPELGKAGRMAIAKAQVLLDRAGASPGVIDGATGSNVAKALDAWKVLTGSALDITNEKALDQMLEARGGPAFVDYRITNEDAAGPYVASVPADYSAKAVLDKLSFTSPLEALAEKFHMDEAFLQSLNPGAVFGRPGTVIKVANPAMRVLKPVARIVADKGLKQVRAYDASGNMVAAYPATIGSADTPSPSGTVAVDRVAFNPEYTYNPKKNFQQGNNDKVLRIPPGPNGPVGTIWIALSRPTYGIHGTPEPSRIGKTNSHGCIRLTNWDADELARLVKPGVSVEFTD